MNLEELEEALEEVLPNGFQIETDNHGQIIQAGFPKMIPSLTIRKPLSSLLVFIIVDVTIIGKEVALIHIIPTHHA